MARVGSDNLASSWPLTIAGRPGWAGRGPAWATRADCAHDFELTNTGIVIRDCTWYRKGEPEWVAFPARPYESNDGAQRWLPIVKFAKDAIQEQALAAIRAHENS